MQLTREEFIVAPPEQVWAVLADPARTPEWMTGVVEHSIPDGQEPGPGAAFAMSIEEGRRLAHYEGRIVTHEPARHLVVEVWGGSFGDMVMTVSYTLSPEGAGTRLAYRANSRPRGLLRLFAPVFRLLGGLQVKRFLRNLRRIVETDAAHRTS